MNLEALIPTIEETHQRVASLNGVRQFKNSLRFVNTSTNMTLDRMILALDNVGAECYLDGFNAGLIAAQKVLNNNSAANKEASNGGTSINPFKSVDSPSDVAGSGSNFHPSQTTPKTNEPSKS